MTRYSNMVFQCSILPGSTFLPPPKQEHLFFSRRDLGSVLLHGARPGARPVRPTGDDDALVRPTFRDVVTHDRRKDATNGAPGIATNGAFLLRTEQEATNGASYHTNRSMDATRSKGHRY